MVRVASAQHRSSSGRGRRLQIVRLGLAALVFTGAGAALTMAAWTDGTFFAATASSGAIDLQGAVEYVDSGDTAPEDLDWQDFPSLEESGQVVRFVPPAIDFENLGPDESRSATLWVRNAGSLPIRLLFDQTDASAVSWSGADVFPAPPAVVVSATDPAGTPVPSIDGRILAVDEWLTVTVTVTTPEDWAQENAGRSGELDLVFSATTDGAD